jgi:hypothetical protein
MLRIVMLLLATLPALAASLDPRGVLSQPQPSANGLGLTLEFPAPQLESVPGGLRVRLAGEGLWGEAGCPDLPSVIRHVRIPARSGVQLRVEEAVWSSLGTQSVAPVQERLHTEADLPLPWLRDEAVYGTDAAWPTQWISLSEPMLMREIRLVTLAVAPLRWNPVSGELERLERLRVELTFQGRDDTNMPLRDEEEGLSDESEGLIYAAQAAEEQFIRQMMGHRLLDPVTGTDWSEAGSLDAITWSAPALPLNYLVITKNAAVNQAGFQSWLTWKRRKGHHVTVLTETNISAWNATGIRNAIISEYNSNTLHPPHYVMLVGDPTDGSYVLPTDQTQYDHYFAAIAGNDILADVVVGRISVTSAAQLNSVFAKIVGYETAPYLDNTSWLRRASFLTGQGHCGESMSQLSRDIAFQLRLERGYTQTDTAFCANSPSYVYNWFNQGISHYTYRGWIGMEGLSTDQLINLQQGPRTPIAVVFTCSSGEFYQSESWGPAYSEAFLRGGTVNTPGGAAAAMGFCTSQTHTAYNNLVAGGFWSALLDYRIPQVGTCMFRGKLELFNTLPPGDSNVTNFSRWANLMGDPGMEQWCGVPDSLRLTGLPVELGTGAQLLELTVTNAENAPVEGVAVCAWMSGDDKVIGLTNAAGQVQLELPAQPEGNLQITATKAYCVPVLQTVRVDVDNATPVLAALTVVDASGDGLLTPGETCTLSLTITNSSTSATLPTLSLVAELVDAESGTILDGVAQLPELAPLGSAELTGELQLTVSDQWTEGLPVEVTLRLGDSHLLRATLPLSTPSLRVASNSWVTTPLYPGETKDWFLRLENSGNRTSRDLSIHATFGSDEFLSITPDSHHLDSLAVGATQVLVFTVTAAANLVPGFTLPLYLIWGDADIQVSGTITTPLVLGNQQVTDPTGPDAHGYYAFESTDTQWMQSPTYNWVEIAPNAGGTGTVVNLHDNGDEQDDSRRVNLPFPFQVYGQAYNSLAVCSNGFVAFGELAHLQTDFRNHFLPCGMGPEPMLAPMWDDFNLEGDAQVVTKYVEDQQVFVIEWYRMRTNSNNAINTFQLLLYDPAVYPTPTGDGEFVYQYHTFTDTQQNDQDFPYCTVGLKNQDATIGLTLINYRQRPSTAAAFGTGKAIRFSTSIGLNVDPAALNLSATELGFQLSETTLESVADSLVLGNTGVAPLIWQASILTPDNWPPQLVGEREQGGPDSFGYTWMDSEEDGGPVAGWVDVWDAGSEVLFTDEDITAAPIDLPFPFPFYGEAKTQLWVHSNGFMAFTEPQGGMWQNNVAVPGTSAPDQSIMAWWDDLMSDESFNGYVRFWTNNADSVVVTWNTVPHNNPVSYGGPFTFQVVLESNGRFALNYGEMNEEDVDSDSGTIGVQLNSTTGFAIRRMVIARDNVSIRVLPPFWLTLDSTFGAVASGEERSLTLHARNDLQGVLLPPGDYTAQVELRTNDPEHATVLLPVTMRVSDVALDPGAGPARFALGQATPNPFNPVARLDLQVPMAGPVRADLFNVAGQYVGTVFRGQLPAGTHALRVDGSRLASGVYLLKVEAGPHSAVRKLTLLK